MKTKCPTSIILEGFWLTSKGPDDLRNHVDTCDVCQEKIRDWEADRRTFLQKYPFERFRREPVIEKESVFSRIWQYIFAPVPIWKPALIFATLASLIILALLPRHEQDIILSKGGPDLGFYILHGGEIIRGNDQAKISPDDKLQFYYSSDKQGYLLFLGVEKNGSLSVYFPFKGSESGPMLKGEKVFFEQSIRWTPHSNYERFFAFFSKQPVSVREIDDRIKAAIGAGTTVDEIKKLPVNFQQTSFIIYRNEN